jgi:hypothetical protein
MTNTMKRLVTLVAEAARAPFPRSNPLGSAARRPWLAQLTLAAAGLLWAASASAQVPIPSTATPTLHGGTPVNGSAVLGEIGYAALRGSFYMGDADSDFGIELAAPTFGTDPLHGWGQSIGIDVRAPFRFLVSRWPKANGSFKVGPYFHAGRPCFYRGPNGRRRGCDANDVGLGVNFGYVTDIALPKIFKLIVGVEQQMGLYHYGAGDRDYSSNFFAAATWVDLGLEAFWRNMFFTMIINVGAQYGSDRLWEDDRALFRQMFGFGYKFR